MSRPKRVRSLQSVLISETNRLQARDRNAEHQFHRRARNGRKLRAPLVQPKIKLSSLSNEQLLALAKQLGLK